MHQSVLPPSTGRLLCLWERVYKIIARDCFVHYAQTEREYNTAHNRGGPGEGGKASFQPKSFRLALGHTRGRVTAFSLMTTTSNSGLKSRSLTAPTYE